MEDRSITQRQIAEILAVSQPVVHAILHDHLHMKKVCTKWVPRTLTGEMRQSRLEFSEENLALIRQDSDGFFARLVIGDEVWIHHYDPETQQEAKQWKHDTSPTPMLPRAGPSAGKVMMTVFWDCEGILLIDFLPHKKTVTGDYYASLMRACVRPSLRSGGER